MFESWLEESLGDPGALLHLAADNLIAERRAGCRKLLIAAAWADCHGAPDDRAPDHQSALVDQYVQSGGMGTPLVSQDCAAELGHTLQVSAVISRKMIADALTIRHRLPLLWQRVKDGEVWGWKAVKIAEATRHLGGLSSWALDRQTTPYVELMAWTRFLDVLDAALLRVDEASYQARAEAAASQRDVRSYRGQHGLRTLVARAEAGDVAAFEALVELVAACLAEEGDEDRSGSAGPRRSGSSPTQPGCGTCWPGTPTSPMTPGRPEDQVAAYQDDPTDPWAADDLPPAGWETERHGNYHQPGLHDLDDLDDCWASQVEDPDPRGWDEPHDQEPVDPADQDWADQQPEPTDDDTDPADSDDRGKDSDDGSTAPAAQPAKRPTPVPAAFDRNRGLRDHRGACLACGSTFDQRPYSTTELPGCRTKTVVHVHVTDRTLIDQHGILRTADGPITLDQFRRWLTDADPTITIRPVLDPAAVAAVDSYEIPMAIREAVHTRHPGSIWPFSPVTAISTGGRLDLDHTISYRPDGPPGQTGVDKLGPVARCEHQPKTHGGWQTRQPQTGIYLWRSPHGWISIATNQGTLLLGDNPYAHALWQAAHQPSPPPPADGPLPADLARYDVSMTQKRFPSVSSNTTKSASSG